MMFWLFYILLDLICYYSVEIFECMLMKHLIFLFGFEEHVWWWSLLVSTQLAWRLWGSLVKHTSVCAWVGCKCITLATISDPCPFLSGAIPLLLLNHHKISSFAQLYTSTTFLPWSQLTMDWIPLNHKPKYISLPLNCKCCVLYPATRKLTNTKGDTKLNGF